MKFIYRAKLLAIVLFSLWSIVATAQVVVLKGHVNDEEMPLVGATVSIANITQATDANGRFSFNINPGYYKLTISHAGFENIEQDIVVTAGENLPLVINMIKSGTLGEVVVLGSRSAVPRSSLYTAVPVDNITSKDLRNTGQPSLIQMLQFSVPSFNVSRQHLTEPVTFRGLNPDHLLILLDGTRYHHPAGINTGGIRGTLGRGAETNNLNSIPFSAIEKIEILRDGASSQYGSDAIAGVMNIELKKTTGKTFITLHGGEHYAGDGENFLLGVNHGVALGKTRLPGYLNLSADLRYRKPTHRGGVYQGTVYYNIPRPATQKVIDSLTALDNIKIKERGFNRKTAVSNDGSIQFTSAGFLVNGGYPVNSKIDLFWTGSVNYSQPVVQGSFIYPRNNNQVNIALYPNGFKPRIIVNSWDITGRVGAKGKTGKGWEWEWNSVYGSNSGKITLKNTNNASQSAFGANAQTEFYAGSNTFMQLVNSVSFARDFANKIKSVKSFNIAWGAEYRIENVKKKQGEEAAWFNYDSTGRTAGGVQPSPGTHPHDEVNETRSIAGLYLDVESDITDRLLINISGRYESYQEFGDNLAGKLAMRYKFAPILSLRGSISNSYHAPALQQIYYGSTNSGFRNVGGVNIPILIGTFSNKSEVTKAFGVKNLQPEKAVNLAGGITSSITKNISLTVDLYLIQIKNRIVLSGRFDRAANPEVNRILENLPNIDQVQFITNAINSRTRGADIVLKGNWKFNPSTLVVVLAANFTRTNIFGPVQTTDSLTANTTNENILFNREERSKLENGQPKSRIILSGNYKIGNTELIARLTRFGNTSAVYNSVDPTLDEFFSPKVLTDFSIKYSPTKWLTLTLGANNVFDVYPDRLKHYTNTNLGILVYGNEAMPFEYNGGYYFVSMDFNW